MPKRGGDYPMHHQALQDLQRSVRVVRSRAAEWGVDPENIDVCGFSAGGHLCATLCANFRTDAYEPIDAIDKASARPDFALLIYPAYLTDPIDSNDVNPLMKNLQRNETPPLFFAVAEDDRFARGVLNYFIAVQAAKLPAECHVYAAGGHGGGMDPGSYPASSWPEVALRWLRDLESAP